MTVTDHAIATTASTYPVWLPMTHTTSFVQHGRSIVSGKGIRVWDEDGREYISGASGLWNVNCGYGHPRIIRAITEQLERLSYGTLFRYGNQPALELAHRLLDITPGRLSTVFYTCSGSAAVETSLKAVRRYWRLVGQPQRQIVVSLQGSYHGTMYGSMSVSGEDIGQEEYGVDRRQVRLIPAPDATSCASCGGGPCTLDCSQPLLDLLETEGSHIAAIIIEPILGTGCHVLPSNYVRLLDTLRSEYGFHLIVDEVATGFGRTGRMFASEWYGLEPDVMVLSKGINSGYLPLAATLFSDAIHDAFDRSGAVFCHGETQSGNPAACAAALATLDVMAEEGLVQNAEEMGARLLAGLAELSVHPCVGPARGRGLMAALDLVAAGTGRRPSGAHVMQTIEMLLDEGLIVHPQPGGIGLLPPLTLEPADVDEMLSILDTVLSRLYLE